MTKPQAPSPKIIKVISGGQTGADLGALIGAREAGCRTGGTAPKGWRTEDGANPSLKDFGLVESFSRYYHFRTIANVKDSYCTVIIGNPDSPGSQLTANYCTWHRKAFVQIPYPNLVALVGCKALLRDFIYRQRGNLARTSTRKHITLNVAGNRESKNPGIQEFTRNLIREIIQEQEQ